MVRRSKAIPHAPGGFAGGVDRDVKMSYVMPNRNRYGPGWPFLDDRETSHTCPICGEDIAWWEEFYIFNGKGNVCHEKCLLKCLEDIENGC